MTTPAEIRNMSTKQIRSLVETLNVVRSGANEGICEKCNNGPMTLYKNSLGHWFCLDCQFRF